MNALRDLGSLLLSPLYDVVSAVLVGWYAVLTDALGLDPAGGAAWVLSIIGLTVTVRVALLPLVVRQVRSTRAVRRLQPQLRELQETHGHDRERLAQETMALYRDNGTNPFASCLPLLVQVPVFFALFRLVDQAAQHQVGHGFLTSTLAARFAGARVFGDVSLAASFLAPQGVPGARLVALVLVLTMAVTTFVTQRQVLCSSAPVGASRAPLARQQHRLLLVLPVVFAVGGVAFPLAVLVYWTTSSLWTLGQQLCVSRSDPGPDA